MFRGLREECLVVGAQVIYVRVQAPMNPSRRVIYPKVLARREAGRLWTRESPPVDERRSEPSKSWWDQGCRKPQYPITIRPLAGRGSGVGGNTRATRLRT